MSISSSINNKINNPEQESMLSYEQNREQEKGPFEERKDNFKDSKLTFDILITEAHPVNQSVRGLLKAKNKGLFQKITEEQFNEIGKNDGCDGALIAAIYEMKIEEELSKKNKSH